MKNPLLIALLVVGLALVAIGLYSISSPSRTTSQKEGFVVLKEGSISVSQPWTSVGKFKGKIVVLMSGAATVDVNFPPATPDGMDKIAPAFFILPGERVFCSLAKHDGKIEKVGMSKEIYLLNETELFLGINEDINKQDGEGFEDNKGSWSYKILVH